MDLQSSVISYLTNRSCRVSPDWIRQQLPENINTAAESKGRYEEEIYRRWLALDWIDPAVKPSVLASLPANASLDNVTFQKRTIPGKYLVQVTSILDISKPLAYDQEDPLEKENGGSDDDGDDDNFANLFKKGAAAKQTAKSKAKKGAKQANAKKERFFTFGARMLQLCITDGHTDSVAIEYQPIPMLNQDMTGAKLLISGPFEVRLGIFLLRANNVQVIWSLPPTVPQPVQISGPTRTQNPGPRQGPNSGPNQGPSRPVLGQNQQQNVQQNRVVAPNPMPAPSIPAPAPPNPAPAPPAPRAQQPPTNVVNNQEEFTFDDDFNDDDFMTLG